ncbi:MAG: DOMON domain-containing protein [Armatimonadota bacterium]|nr:DOMON domain-containing protein [Armatimonadota bacterium]MDR7451312.1 DOMON domain-containing protein [Armatimonadota bacterium]MDR7466785.1 DOMON domain-containing protein [Armatimonadota bacterium]MDR7492742.1 DOMON domain-containing protein [Armatimonadota bacterium]MDR7498518.1 DOMON domain-containing protein [Armatimonadota bacterium]
MRIAGLITAFALSISLGAFPILAQTQAVVDGKIAPGEYARTYTHDASGIRLAWRVSGDILQLAIQASGDGWIGIGFLAKRAKGKQGADQYIFSTEGGKPVALDLYQSAVLGRPVLDEEEGGKNSILQSAVVREGKNWTVEFTRKLRTGEKTDMEIVPGKKFSLLLALGATENWKQPHKNTQRWEIGGFAS